MREAMAGAFGGTRQTERTVAAALNWIARHQNPDGSWSLDEFQRRCKDKSCTCQGELKSDAAATALALLPFLAAGQTQDTKGPYQKTIRAGLHWLVNLQLSDGSLIRGGSDARHVHARPGNHRRLRTFALTKDSRIGAAAQKAVEFIESAQNESGGGWHYDLDARRHLGHRLASHGFEKRPDGRAESRSGNVQGNQKVLAQRGHWFGRRRVLVPQRR